jgi:hypothetical protein
VFLFWFCIARFWELVGASVEVSGCIFHDFAVADNFIGGGIGLTFLFGVGVITWCRAYLSEGFASRPSPQQK